MFHARSYDTIIVRIVISNRINKDIRNTFVYFLTEIQVMWDFLLLTVVNHDNFGD